MVLKSVLDFDGNEYKIVECKPTGYYIIHPASGIILEYSFTSVSPYEGFYEKLYYAGPTYYYVESGGNYKHTYISSTIDPKDISNIALLCKENNSELISQKNSKITSFLNGTVDKLSDDSICDVSKTTTYWVTNHNWFENRVTKFGYVKGGYCGYIAANLVLKYWHYRGDISLPSYHSSIGSTKLTKYLISLGSNPQTFAWDIEGVINEYANIFNIPQEAEWAYFDWNLRDEIRIHQRPVILFGNMPNAGNHAVVAYGYKEGLDPRYYTIICHYGHKNKSKIYLYSGLVIFGSNTQYQID